jgi:hypothetical protein
MPEPPSVTRKVISAILGPRLGEELAGPVGVVREGLDLRVVGPFEGRRDRPVGDCRGPLEHVLDDRALVDRVVRRLPHPDVREGPLAGVEDREPDMGARLLVDLEARALELTERDGGHLDHDVDAAGEHLGDPGVGVGDRPEDDRVEGGRAVPVILEALDDDAGVRLPLGEAEGAGADGVAAEFLAPRPRRRRARR